jgi:hypothetical protein
MSLPPPPKKTFLRLDRQGRGYAQWFAVLPANEHRVLVVPTRGIELHSLRAVLAIRRDVCMYLQGDPVVWD